MNIIDTTAQEKEQTKEQTKEQEKELKDYEEYLKKIVNSKNKLIEEMDLEKEFRANKIRKEKEILSLFESIRDLIKEQEDITNLKSGDNKKIEALSQILVECLNVKKGSPVKIEYDDDNNYKKKKNALLIRGRTIYLEHYWYETPQKLAKDNFSLRTFKKIMSKDEVQKKLLEKAKDNQSKEKIKIFINYFKEMNKYNENDKTEKEQREIQNKKEKLQLRFTKKLYKKFFAYDYALDKNIKNKKEDNEKISNYLLKGINISINNPHRKELIFLFPAPNSINSFSNENFEINLKGYDNAEETLIDYALKEEINFKAFMKAREQIKELLKDYEEYLIDKNKEDKIKFKEVITLFNEKILINEL